MKFTETVIKGVFRVDLEKREDERGFFARLFCEKEFETHGLMRHIAQANNSLSRFKGTLRGLHYQLPPGSEVKLIYCIQGAIFDVAVDLRKNSPTYGQWYGCELSKENRTMLYVPEGCAHGFLSLVDDCELFYMASQFYNPAVERGVRWNDPTFNIKWPFEPVIMSDKDRNLPDYQVSKEAM